MIKGREFSENHDLENEGMTDRLEISGLHVARELADFVVEEVIPGTGD